MRAPRSIVVFAIPAVALASLASCNAALDVLASDASTDGGEDGSSDTATPPDGAGPLEGGVADGSATDGGWPGPPGTVVPLASGLANAVDIDVDDAFVYVAIGVRDGGVVRIPKRGGTAVPIAEHQAGPSGVRATSRGVVWTLSPGVAPAEPSVMMLPRDGGAPVPLVVGGYDADALAADGDRVAWVDHAGGEGRIMVAELDKGSMRPIVDKQLGIGGIALEGDRVVWTARCSANVCGGYVVGSPIAVPNTAQAWSTTSNVSMRGIAIQSGTIGFGWSSTQGVFFARLPPGSASSVDYPGNADVVSQLRRDGDAFVFLSRSGNDVALARVLANGTAAPQTLTTSPGASGAVAVDGPAIYWISAEEGVLRAIAR